MNPTIQDIIAHIQDDQEALGITLYPAATDAEIEAFEQEMMVKLPEDVKTFYKFTNGFESEADMFRIIPLHDIVPFSTELDIESLGPHDFHIADYMEFAGNWTISIADQGKSYSIYILGEGIIVLTNSFTDFLQRFLQGGVFAGLHDWGYAMEQSSGQSDLSNNAGGASD
jgi:hypothetical protein